MKKNYSLILRKIIFAFNSISVIGIAIFILYTTRKICDAYVASDFLEKVNAIPANPSALVGEILVLVAIMGISFICREKFVRENTGVYYLTLLIDFCASFFIVYRLDFNYNGILLWVFTNLIAHIKDMGGKYALAVISLLSYIGTNHGIISVSTKIFSVSDYIRCWGQKPCYSTLKILHKFFNFPQMWYTVYINQRWWKCMAFRTNSYQQLSFADSFEGLTFREQKALEHSWAKVFAEDIFPAINEEPFRVLYSSNASRPNTPVNVCIGALIIKELFGISDDEVVENLMLDPRYQYALHTSSFEEQPLSDKTLTRFRKRCYDYESIHGIDLLHECMTGLGTNIAKLMDISPRVKRMDSMMIAANIRKLSRIELLYTCVKKLVIYFHKNSRDELIKGMEHYCDPNDYNKTFYYSNDSDTENHLAAILKDADRLLDLCGTDYDDITEYQLLVRCLSEQTIVEEGFRRLRTKEDGGFHSGILQNPSDPDATYRSKAGKEHQGYVANLEETVDRNGSVITDYQFEQNIYSDSRFLKDSLERTEVQEKKSTLITDGAYSGKENHDLAAQKNIRLINTDLSGKPVDDILADFVFNETGTKVVRCPAGYEPKSCGYTGDKSQQFHVSFQKEQCANCPHKAQCKAKIYKRVSRVTVSVKSHERAKQQRFMGTEEFRNLFKIRNGVETLPSLLRRRYHADRMSVRGLIRGRFFFGCKIGALNFKKLFTYRKGLGHYAQNPVLA